jgi:hypothetical protein
MTETANRSEFLLGLEEYLKYIGQPTAADHLHSVARSLQSQDPQLELTRSHLRYLSATLPPELRDLADLVHSINKSGADTEQIYRTLLNYCTRILKTLGQYQELDSLADLCHSVTKSSTNEQVYRTLLTYCARVLKTTSNSQELDSLADLCHSINKSESVSEAVYKSILLYNTNFIKSCATVTQSEKEQAILRDLASLCHNTKTSADIKDIYKALLLHTTNMVKIQGLEELGTETAKILRSMGQEDFAEVTVKTQLAKLDRQFPNDSIFRSIMSYLKLNLDGLALQDAFSRSQIKSKIWMVHELANLNVKYHNVLVMAGWFGQLKSIYKQQLTYRKMRVLELDRTACETSDYVFNLDNLTEHKVKAVCTDINQLTLYKNGYEWSVENFRDGTTYSEKFLPDLIINTSAEHMTEEWFHQLRFKQLDSDPIVAIQSNNLFDIPEHVNCVHSVDHMMKKFPLREVLFAGELQLKGYKRVMLIGRV